MENINIKNTENKATPRDHWYKRRRTMEGANLSEATPGRIKSVKKWFIFSYALKFMNFFLKKTRLFQRGYRNANELEVNLVEHTFKELPIKFNGTCILHLSDLHLQDRENLSDYIISLVQGHHVDILVFTGDFSCRGNQTLSDDEISARVKNIIDAVKPKIGAFGVLGNHDHASLAGSLESIGLKMLINEVVDLNRNGSSIRMIGTDDPHYYYTNDSKIALSSAHEKFSIALVHTPELYDLALFSGVNLYLTGHSHGGQICLPFGIPIFTHLNAGKRFFRGKWNIKEMVGYTSKGAGTIALPVRFNAYGEVTFHYLRTNLAA